MTRSPAKPGLSSPPRGLNYVISLHDSYIGRVSTMEWSRLSLLKQFVAPCVLGAILIALTSMLLIVCVASAQTDLQPILQRAKESLAAGDLQTSSETFYLARQRAASIGDRTYEADALLGLMQVLDMRIQVHPPTD